MDEARLHAAVPYALLNPVRAGLATGAEDGGWSSIHAHPGRPSGLTDAVAVRSRVPGPLSMLAAHADDEHVARIRRAETTGRPVGSAGFLDPRVSDGPSAGGCGMSSPGGVFR